METIAKTWIQDDSLKNQIDWDAVMPMSRYAGGHDEQMRGLFKGATILAHWNEGDYQGIVATAVQLADGRCVMYNDYYGSCSGCDSWENADDQSVRSMCEGLANGAYVFPGPAEGKSFLMSVVRASGGDEYRRVSSDAGFQWQYRCAKGLLDNWSAGAPQ